MKIGVLSDTHGNVRLMNRAAALLVKRFGACHLIHLGDDWEDQGFLIGVGVPVSGVPGLWCDAYHDPRIPNVRIDPFSGVHVAYAHSESDLCQLGPDIGLVLVGHTHRAAIRARQGIPWLNPGHLKDCIHRNQPASFGLVDLREKEICLSIYEIDGGLRKSRSFPRRDGAAEKR